MKMTRVATLAFAASVFLATGAYAASSQTNVVPATATISNTNSPVNSLTVLWTNMSLDCGTYQPSTSTRYAVGASCGALGPGPGNANATAQITQSGAIANMIVVTATDVFAGNTPSRVTLTTGGQYPLGVDLALMAGSSAGTVTSSGVVLGTFYLPATTTSYIAITGALATAIGYTGASDQMPSGGYTGSFTAVVSY